MSEDPNTVMQVIDANTKDSSGRRAWDVVEKIKIYQNNCIDFLKNGMIYSIAASNDIEIAKASDGS